MQENFKIIDKACYKGSYFEVLEDNSFEGITDPSYCDNHLFFDKVHPTTKAHKLFADFIYEDVTKYL